MKKNLRTLVILLCAIILLAGALYCANWMANRSRIIEKNLKYSQLYTPATQAPTFTPGPTEAPLPAIIDEPIATPDSETIVMALPTPPPVQDSFAELLKTNPETIGFLKIEDMLSLPVVQRKNDNDFYLNHNFEQAEAVEGTLFLDGLNLLVPEDDCLIIYGHNMHNGTMFGTLQRYGEADFLRNHPIVQFDTIYENRAYVPIAAFPASMDPDDADYFDVRRFAFDGLSFEQFVEELKARSVVNTSESAAYGDRLLLLVTCDYANNDGRFILALKQTTAHE